MTTTTPPVYIKMEWPPVATTSQPALHTPLLCLWFARPGDRLENGRTWAQHLPFRGCTARGSSAGDIRRRHLRIPGYVDGDGHHHSSSGRRRRRGWVSSSSSSRPTSFHADPTPTRRRPQLPTIREATGPRPSIRPQRTPQLPTIADPPPHQGGPLTHRKCWHCQNGGFGS